MTREVILIGGKFHRQRMRINDSQHTIRIPLIAGAKAYSKIELGTLEPIEYVEYGQVASIFGEYGIIPANVFIENTISVVDFLRNLVLDYTR